MNRKGYDDVLRFAVRRRGSARRDVGVREERARQILERPPGSGDMVQSAIGDRGVPPLGSHLGGQRTHVDIAKCRMHSDPLAVCAHREAGVTEGVNQGVGDLLAVHPPEAQVEMLVVPSGLWFECLGVMEREATAKLLSMSVHKRRKRVGDDLRRGSRFPLREDVCLLQQLPRRCVGHEVSAGNDALDDRPIEHGLL